MQIEKKAWLTPKLECLYYSATEAGEATGVESISTGYRTS